MDVEPDKSKNRIIVSIIPTESDTGLLEPHSIPRLSFSRTPKGLSQSLTPSNKDSWSSCNNISQLSISPSNYQASPKQMERGKYTPKRSAMKRTTMGVLNSLPHNRNSKPQKSVYLRAGTPSIDLHHNISQNELDDDI